ncbi:hypothetical protein [Lysinibacillus sp. SGAir0095]|uniref:hypothetical protein n=1 Tax=Lysinibacillus sp. SGAir0095 TaxID=2070463 RepID=UPI0010CD0E6E|nr:hypothetical protein [Lysinibacillus sp. SGAir0095]QCR32709.1 hypothetical protein C1N55_11225 [Lysinibacillus sp. SGAir0095]
MSYPYLLLICLLMMISIALVMYYLGTKISYNYILYNASVSIGSGVVFFLFKIIFTIDHTGLIEQLLDLVIVMLLITVWLVTLVETLTVEIMENGREIKGNIIYLAKKIKTIEIKSIPSQIARRINSTSNKAKSYLLKNKLTVKVQKLVGELSKNRELNKRV